MRAGGWRGLLRSPELWATVDLCNTAREPHDIGIAASMPGDGHTHDAMYMNFRLQYLNAVNQWVDLVSSSSGYRLVGDASVARQEGRLFELKPREAERPYEMRGVVDFRWTHGRTVMLSASRYTTAGRAVAGGRAEPKGFSAATCQVG